MIDTITFTTIMWAFILGIVVGVIVGYYAAVKEVIKNIKNWINQDG